MLRLVSYDDRFDPTQALANVRRLVEQDKVTAIFQAFADSTAAYVTSNGTPLITWGLTAKPFSSRYPAVIPMLGNLLVWNHQSWGSALKAMGVPVPKRVAILYDNYLFDSKAYLPYLKETWEKIGAEVVSMDALSLKDGDCTNVAIKMRSLDVDFWAFDGSGFILCVPAAQRIGWKPSIGWGGWPVSHAKFLEPLGDYADGMIRAGTGDRADGTPGWGGTTGVYPALAEFQEAMARYSPKNANNATYDSPSVNYWAGVLLLKEALEHCDDASKKCLLDYIHSLRNWTGGGITPPVLSFAPNCKTGSYQTFWGRYDAKQKVFKPLTGYLDDPFFEQYGGACGITKLADELAG
jgi:ABC-type branched-subunit amino acid transport system substrate-binding protein